MSRIKEKISAIVSSQLPEFIQTDYTTFVAFVEAYYRFLEQDQGAYELIQNSRSYSDIDKTTPAFVKYFLKNYAKDIPTSTLANQKVLIKKIKDLYESKGSELSFKLLFRILYNTDISIFYPYEFVLRASGGTWQQLNSLRLQTVFGNREDLLNRSITYTTGGIVYTTPVIEVKNLTSTLTEVFLDPNFLAPTYTTGDTVTVIGSSGTVFVGTISPTTTSYEIVQAGSGFKAGQIYTINFGGGINTLIKVSNVTSSGGISELKFVSYGYGFNSIFTVELDPTKTISETVDVIQDKTLGFQSFGEVFKFDPTSPDVYFLQDYVSGNTYTLTSVEATFGDNVYSAFTTTSSTPANFASITFRLGALARYPGAFTTNKGFLSEPDIRLQDDKLYQPFAYQTITDKEYEEFFGVVKQIVHPAGQNLFNNRIINNDIDLSGNISVLSRSNIFFEALSVFDTSELFAVDLAKEEDDTVISTEQAILNVSLAISDAANAVEEATLTINKSISDDVIMSNPGNVVYTQDLRYFLEDYVSEDYNENIVNVTTITIS